MVCDNDILDDCFIFEICVVLIIEFLIYIFILLFFFLWKVRYFKNFEGILIELGYYSLFKVYGIVVEEF